MKTLINKATEGKDANRNPKWDVLTSSNSFVCSAETQAEAEEKAAKKPGHRATLGWTEGGYKVFVGVKTVLVANDHTEEPEWKVKASFWLPTYGLAVSTATELCNL